MEKLKNGKPVKEYLETEGCKNWILENGKNIFELSSSIGLNEIDGVTIMDEDKGEVSVVINKGGRELKATAHQLEIGDVFLPLVLQKLATARMLIEIGKASVDELSNMGMGELMITEIGLLGGISNS